MKKEIQTAFAIALLVVSVMATFIKSMIFESIVCAIIIPSFLLSLVSLLTEISKKCRENAVKFKDAHSKLGDAQSEYANCIMVDCSQDVSADGSNRHFLEQEKHVHQNEAVYYLQESNENSKTALVYQRVEECFIRFEKGFNYISIFVYTLLFLALILSPYIVKWLSSINMGCISLWSLTLLYLSLEFKSTLCGVCLELIKKICKKTVKKQ